MLPPSLLLTMENPAMTDHQSDNGRRRFLQQSALVSAGMLATTLPAAVYAAVTPQKDRTMTITTRGYAAFDTTGVLRPWTFERRAVGDNDILIDVKFASICHSDIHQMKGHWGPQQYPQVPGHEIAGIVTAVGKNVTRFRVGDRAGVGCMVDGCTDCADCHETGEQYCADTVFTYGYPEASSPTGISQGGYSDKLVVRDHFAVHIPENIRLQDAAPLLCAGVTTYSPLMKMAVKQGDRIGVAGIGGLGHLAVKLAVSKGAEVVAFTTTADKRQDILSFGAKEVVVVDDLSRLNAYRGQLDYMISTLPVQYDVAAYVATVKPSGTFMQVGMPEGFSVNMNALALAASRVNFQASLIGSMKETQDVVNYCASHQVLPAIEVISAQEINQAWQKVVNKEARYRYVIDASSFTG